MDEADDKVFNVDEADDKVFNVHKADYYDKCWNLQVSERLPCTRPPERTSRKSPKEAHLHYHRSRWRKSLQSPWCGDGETTWKKYVCSNIWTYTTWNKYSDGTKKQFLKYLNKYLEETKKYLLKLYFNFISMTTTHIHDLYQQGEFYFAVACSSVFVVHLVLRLSEILEDLQSEARSGLFSYPGIEVNIVHWTKRYVNIQKSGRGAPIDFQYNYGFKKNIETYFSWDCQSRSHKPSGAPYWGRPGAPHWKNRGWDWNSNGQMFCHIWCARETWPRNKLVTLKNF